METVNYMEKYRTLTGITITEALVKLQEVLPPNAYKGVPGGADLTDIDPSYLTQVATEVFGLAGIGWAYNYWPDHLSVTSEVRKKSNGGERKVYIASLNYLELRFRYVVSEQGELVWSDAIPATGGSENDNESFAVRGALTNAIGAAFAKLCWQLPVYQGKLTHKNAATVYNKKNGIDPTKSQAQVAKPAQDTETKQAEQKTQPAKSTVKKGSNGNGATVEDLLVRAKAVVIPEGIAIPKALIGKTLGDAVNDPLMGAATLLYLAGKDGSAAGQLFTPNSDAETRLQAAAAYILEHSK